ncbi:NAD(P)/FAD-dependent oxidoreductase [Actinomadura soli]|uniref:NAD(P)/FAD-dependent oxidoreductase n=1 Tax=Actinomadura soli TaxID=2508997 RepID=A0A5C4JEM9_9ACTN|nr:FAD-dependent oxidoreductase [Actinomadura soli]TMR01938.1 NAD(P)/FAD-dependent oxidoreductase [Actinomadura soli]
MSPAGTAGIVVVGNGMAGSRLVGELRARDAATPVTVFGAEPQRPYNRVLLSNVLAGVTRPEHIGLVDAAWYASHGVDARLGVEVTRVDRAAKTVHASDGTDTPYGTLVLATGSAAFVPPLPGLRDGLPDGALVFRTLDDCRRISVLAESARRAVVVGGGLLGIEAARGLAGRGLDVTVLHQAGHLMERQLDRAAGKFLARTLAALGIATRLQARVTGLRTSARGAVTGVELALPGGGTETADTDLVVLSCGVRPKTALARDAGLAVGRGVIVDDELRSVTDPSVRAIGECSEHRDEVYGLVAPAWEQAGVLAGLLAGTDPAARFTGARQITRLKAAGIELASMGETHFGDDDAGVEIVRFTDAARGTYKKAVIRDGRLIGAILLGETSAAGTLTQLYDRAGPLPAERLGLLFPGLDAPAPAGEPLRMPEAATVCHCNDVSKGRIRACWERGARTAADVARETRAGTGCGTCRDAVEGIVAWLAGQEPARVP